MDHEVTTTWVCGSCARLSPPDVPRCPCWIERREFTAHVLHTQRRANRPALLRPRTFERLPRPIQEWYLDQAGAVLDALEAGGWVLRAVDARGRHAWADEAQPDGRPPRIGPPTDPAPVPHGELSRMAAEFADTTTGRIPVMVDPGPVVPAYVRSEPAPVPDRYPTWPYEMESLDPYGTVPGMRAVGANASEQESRVTDA